MTLYKIDLILLIIISNFYHHTQHVLKYMAEGGSVLYDINETILYETLFEAVVRRDRLVSLVYGRIRTRLPYDDTRLRQYLRQRDDMDMDMVTWSSVNQTRRLRLRPVVSSSSIGTRLDKLVELIIFCRT